jgi:hypothetical protein
MNQKNRKKTIIDLCNLEIDIKIEIMIKTMLIIV